MLKEILEKLEDIQPKSLFTKIEADKDRILLTVNHEHYDLRELNTVRLDVYSEYVNIFRDDFLFGTATSAEETVNLIYSAMKCGRVELTFEKVIYDVWGNEEDGFQVNDQTSYEFPGEVCIHLPSLTILNNEKDVCLILGLKSSDYNIEWSDYGIPLNAEKLDEPKYVEWGYYFSSSSNGEPIGEVRIAYTQKNINLLNSLR